MSQTIAPKSDQLNADDLIGGPRTITITRVTGNEGNAEQPVNIFFEGDNGKPFRPCKSMRRVMVKIWGKDASKYAGQSMTLFRDPKVQWGGMEVGGIRISHMTGLEKKEVMALTASNRARKPYTVSPLTDVPAAQQQSNGPDLGEWARKFIASIGKVNDVATLDAGVAKVRANIDALQQQIPDAHAAVMKAIDDKRATLAGADDDPFGSEVPADDVAVKSPPVDKIRRMIASANTKPDIDAANDMLNQHRDDIDADTLADLDASIADKRDEVK
tara:strand:+ start:34881 stop:35699 length:819 start_codon:yes stop_codon:yes gene_type:complete